MIITWIITIITFFLGYGLAEYKNNPEQVKASFKKLRIKKPQLGGVKRPTAQELVKRGTRQEETEKAMEDTFEKILKKP